MHHLIGLRAVKMAAIALLAAQATLAGVFQLSGNLASPQDSVTFDLTLHTGGTVDLRTFGFGGGGGFSAGGFDPFAGIFQGTGPDAVFIDGSSDILSNYVPNCPPAGRVNIGSLTNQCGDVYLQVSGLLPGDYTILLSDALYYPVATAETGGLLGDGFFDLTDGATTFQTCGDEFNCKTDTANWALDVITPEGATLTATPEPGSLAFMEAVLLLIGFSRIVKNRARTPRSTLQKEEDRL